MTFMCCDLRNMLVSWNYHARKLDEIETFSNSREGGRLVAKGDLFWKSSSGRWQYVKKWSACHEMTFCPEDDDDESILFI